jgi:hypothetical protein
VHLIQVPVDIKIIDSTNVESGISHINIENYDQVIVINCYVSYEKQSFFSTEKTQYISKHLDKYGFILAEKQHFNSSSLTIFEKTKNTTAKARENIHKGKPAAVKILRK